MELILSYISTALLFVLFLISAQKAKREKRLIKLFMHVICLVLVVYILKFSFGISRPSTENILFSFDSYSFPSTHATLSMGLALYLGNIVYVLSAIVISLIRIVIDAHYVRDIIAGWLVALVVFVLFFKVKSMKRAINKSKTLIMRKAIHVVWSLTIIFMLYFFPQHTIQGSLFLSLLYLVFYLTPFGKKTYNKVRYKTRRHDYLSPLFLLWSVAITYYAYGREIALISSIFASFSDSISTIIGKTFPIGKTHNGRHISGTIMGSAVGYIIASFINPTYAFIGALSFIFFEFILPKEINDNIMLSFGIGSSIYIYMVIV